MQRSRFSRNHRRGACGTRRPGPRDRHVLGAARIHAATHDLRHKACTPRGTYAPASAPCKGHGLTRRYRSLPCHSKIVHLSQASRDIRRRVLSLGAAGLCPRRQTGATRGTYAYILRTGRRQSRAAGSIPSSTCCSRSRPKGLQLLLQNTTERKMADRDRTNSPHNRREREAGEASWRDAGLAKFDRKKQKQKQNKALGNNMNRQGQRRLHDCHEQTPKSMQYGRRVCTETIPSSFGASRRQDYSFAWKDSRKRYRRNTASRTDHAEPFSPVPRAQPRRRTTATWRRYAHMGQHDTRAPGVLRHPIPHGLPRDGEETGPGRAVSS